MIAEVGGVRSELMAQDMRRDRVERVAAAAATDQSGGGSGGGGGGGEGQKRK